MIFNFRLGVDHSVLCQMEGVGHVFSNHHNFKCSALPSLPTVRFDQSVLLSYPTRSPRICVGQLPTIAYDPAQGFELQLKSVGGKVISFYARYLYFMRV